MRTWRLYCAVKCTRTARRHALFTSNLGVLSCAASSAIPLTVTLKGHILTHMHGIVRKEKGKGSIDKVNLPTTDIVSREKRSDMMSKVRSKDSLVEKKVRSALHANGYRFRLHRKDLPGTPDIIMSKYRLAIFVHGCFWHRHVGCSKSSMPKSNFEFWEKKFSDNIRRDTKTNLALEALGWRVVILWECEVKKKRPF